MDILQSKSDSLFNIVNQKSQYIPGVQKYLLSSYSPDFNNYYIISIIGPQSSGKSTLINHLFQTKFQTMEALQKRGCTTKGIWLTTTEQHIIMDLQGSDNKLRDQQNFQNSIALFALSLSNILIINLWTFEIGRYKASQYSIIKVIMQMNIKIFKQQSTKNILFIFRDFNDQDDNFNQITRSVKNDIQKIWNQVHKEKQYQGKKYQQFFQLNFFKLAHYIYQREQFDEDIQQLRKFFDPKQKINLLPQQNNLPIYDLQSFSKNIWQTIRTQKDLNLPSQKKMVAKLRCQKISKDILQSGFQKYQQMRKQINEGKMVKLVKNGNRIINQLLQQYLKKSKLYDSQITEQIKVNLVKSLKQPLAQLSVLQTDLMIPKIKQKFYKNLNDAYLANRKDIPSLVHQLNEIMNQTKAFWQQFKQNQLWNKQKIGISQLIDYQILKKLNQCYKQNIQQALDQQFKKLSKKIDQLLENLGLTFWKTLQQDFNTKTFNLRKFNKNILFELYGEKHIQLIEQFLRETDQQLRIRVKKYMSKKIKSFTNNFIKIFRFRFNNSKKNKAQKQSAIQEVFAKQKQILLEQLQIFKYFDLKIPSSKVQFKFSRSTSIVLQKVTVPQQLKSIDDLDKQRILSAPEFNQLRKKLIIGMNEIYQQSISQSVKYYNQKSSLANVPFWLWLVLIFFTYDDILSALSYFY